MVSSSASSEVNIVSECFVKPKTIPQKWKEPYHLSPLGQIAIFLHHIQMGLLFLKPKEYLFMETWLQKLKDSLAATLVHFYPLAGRFSTSKTDNPMSYFVFVDCNNSPGARFIHAKSDLNVGDIVGSKYVPLVVQSFFDHHKALNHDGHTMTLLSVKVTELVDGVFIGLSMNHSIADGSSFWHFFNSWSEIFNSQEETITNKLFSLKNPPILSVDHIFKLPFSKPDVSPFTYPVWKERIFHFSSETLKSLKSKANQECGTTKISSFQSLSAFMWRCITRARKLPNDQETTCFLAADNRPRLEPPLPVDQFGLCISTVKTSMKIGNLLENEFGWAALKLHQAVTEHTGERISSEIDGWLKSPFVMRLDQFSHPTNFHMGSSPRFNKYGPEFGMGKAVAVRSGYAFKFDGKVFSYPGREGGGSIDLEVCLLPKFMEALESDHEFMSLVSSSS